jgi:hypothetical protein
MMLRLKAAGPAMLRLAWGTLAVAVIYGAGFVHGAGLRSLPEWVWRFL